MRQRQVGRVGAGFAGVGLGTFCVAGGGLGVEGLAKSSLAASQLVVHMVVEFPAFSALDADGAAVRAAPRSAYQQDSAGRVVAVATT